MALTVTFDLLSSTPTISVPGPTYASQPVQLVQQFVSGRTADGTRYVYQMTETTRWEWRLAFRDMSRTNKQSLDEFFRLHSRGPSAAFTYTHTDGSTYTARFSQDTLQWSRNHKELWDCDLTIETTTVPN